MIDFLFLILLIINCALVVKLFSANSLIERLDDIIEAQELELANLTEEYNETDKRKLDETDNHSENKDNG